MTDQSPSLSRAGEHSCGNPASAAPFDREKAELALRGSGVTPHALPHVLDALEGCVRPVPATIDRDELGDELRSAYGVTPTSATVDAILALVRPADGVTLTPEEAALAARALRTGLGTRTPAETYRARVALADRLEAAS